MAKRPYVTPQLVEMNLDDVLGTPDEPTVDPVEPLGFGGSRLAAETRRMIDSLTPTERALLDRRMGR